LKTHKARQILNPVHNIKDTTWYRATLMAFTLTDAGRSKTNST